MDPQSKKRKITHFFNYSTPTTSSTEDNSESQGSSNDPTFPHPATECPPPVDGEPDTGVEQGNAPLNLPFPLDVGDVITKRIQLADLSHSDKMALLTNHFVPDSSTTMVTQSISTGKDKRNKLLTFQVSWCKRFPWLVYSKSCEGGLCKYCVLFPPTDPRINVQDAAFVSRPFVRLSKALGKTGDLENHSKLQYHKEAMSMGAECVRAVNKPKQSLSYIISDANKELYDQNFHSLKCIVRAVILCGKQSLPLRGHRDDATSNTSNKGTFLAILQLIAEYDVKLKKHIDGAAKNATGISKTVQNEVINVIGDYIRKQVTAPLNQAESVFTIIADEVTDKYANQEILSLCLRFLDFRCGPLSAKIREAFIDFVHLERTTGEKVSNAIKDCLAKRGIEIKKARGQAYDGAGNMSGSVNGVQALIKQTVPQALYVHCNSHVLNFAIMNSCKLPYIRNMVDVLNSIFLFFDLSPKRQRLLERVIKVYGSGNVKKLKGLCKTRWVERHTCFETFAEMYRVIVITLEAMLYPDQYDNLYVAPDIEDVEETEAVEKWKWDQETRTRANGLLASMKTPANLVSFCVTKNALHLLKAIASKLQKCDLDIYPAYMLIDDTISRLCQVRDNLDAEFADWFHEAVVLAESLETEIKIPRLTGRQNHRENHPGDTPADYFRRSLAIPFIDHLKAEMEERFKDRVGSSLLRLIPSLTLKEENLHELRQALLFWDADLPTPTALLSELKDWTTLWRKRNNHPESLLDSLHSADEDQFPNIRKLLVIGCTLPIGSAEAERSFSAFRRTKTFLRSTMSEERLSGLVLMHIHHDLIIDPDTICNIYIQKHSRRMFESCITRAV